MEKVYIGIGHSGVGIDWDMCSHLDVTHVMTIPSLETVYIGRGWSVMSSASEPSADPGLLEGQTPSSTTWV